MSTLGLLYTTFADGDEEILVPNSVVLASALTPLREPDAVDLRARLPAGTRPDALERLIEDALTTPIRARPSVTVVELDGDEMIVSIAATPTRAEDAGRLAGELLEIVSAETARATGAGGRRRSRDAAIPVDAAAGRGTRRTLGPRRRANPRRLRKLR